MVPGMHMSKPIVYLNIIHGKRVPTPKISLQKCILLIWTWQNNSHTSATETPPTDPHSHMLSALVVVFSSKAGRPRKHNIMGEKGPLKAIIPLQPISIN